MLAVHKINLKSTQSFARSKRVHKSYDFGIIYHVFEQLRSRLGFTHQHATSRIFVIYCGILEMCVL